ncbi:hypothetical protein HNR12_002007 [Streptomonospora nanhaiensis]|uniref:Uncharacterized protein n=1 Tax=Streptomonospora nanhaiensis TaxID=1323731 RepID=A0A853BL57_9ACTN|nr:hypothetical protein [Streptomonospora nanhaiensis]NYI95730.1 hypothetical protein [Streptomonospora nanhaiensis]
MAAHRSGSSSALTAPACSAESMTLTAVWRSTSMTVSRRVRPGVVSRMPRHTVTSLGGSRQV